MRMEVAVAWFETLTRKVPRETKKTLRGADLWADIWTQEVSYKEARLFILEEDILWRFTPGSRYNSVDNF
jgi:hypothetical protein